MVMRETCYLGTYRQAQNEDNARKINRTRKGNKTQKEHMYTVRGFLLVQTKRWV